MDKAAREDLNTRTNIHLEMTNFEKDLGIMVRIDEPCIIAHFLATF